MLVDERCHGLVNCVASMWDVSPKQTLNRLIQVIQLFVMQSNCCLLLFQEVLQIKIEISIRKFKIVEIQIQNVY